MNHIEFYALFPFIGMLLFIAIGPLLFDRWWEDNRNKLIVSVGLSIPTVIYLHMKGNLMIHLEHQILYDYFPFIILLAALFIVTGGIHLSGNIEAKPRVNTAFLAVGYLLASIMGTTGAAMLLIRPLITTNSERKFKAHTILFFIAVVANCGGLLTPLGDPPLFLLYLRGAPFTWFLSLFPQWLFVGVLLLMIYYFVDVHYYKKESCSAILKDSTETTRIRFGGRINLIYLVGVVLSVAFINEGFIPSMKEHGAPMYITFLREIALLSLAVASLITTSKKVRRLNSFTWDPILEVAFLFLGIFVTMTPALLFLEERATLMGLDKSWEFFYGTGSLSAFLDNAPTAVAFHQIGASLVGLMPGVKLVGGVAEPFLSAIAVGSVLFGSMTYIGNGPNFMVKTIAEAHKIPMPSFFAYIFKFSFVVLLPIYVLVQLIFIH
ncbi:MAG: sodium:proton antiporter [Bacteroidaceae bacterium]|nr:sodium:proton antiporter [Bacteroidaceae bacterium]